MSWNCSLSRPIERVLVVGSWSKEQITIENIKNKKRVKIFAYMDTCNPAIISRVDGYRIGEFDDIENITDYAKEENVDLVLITTAEPLSCGAVDALEEEDISVFGPNKDAAKLESDKAFTRELMKKYGMGDALPSFGVFDNEEKAISYAKKLDWNVAVKPVGLTEGLGVKVADEQLCSPEEIKSYIKRVFEEKIGGGRKVVIEEKMKGVEFTIQCFVCDNLLVPTPAVQDFKKLWSGDEGPNTASMGSYSADGYLLPFMEKSDYDYGLELIEDTLNAFRMETGKGCCGFLYGQFMITRDGVKLVEYNFRPGDPEWMNTLTVLKNNVLDVIVDLMNGKEAVLGFEDKATVCKYIVPKGYPEKLYQFLDVSIDEDKIQELGIDFFYSCGLDDKGRLNVRSERGISFVAKEDSIYKASEKIEKSLSFVKGEFYHRPDIGTKNLIDENKKTVSRLRKWKKII